MKKRVFRSIWGLVLVLLVATMPISSIGQTVRTTRRATQFRAGEVVIKVRDELSAISRNIRSNAAKSGSRNLDVLNQQFGIQSVTPVFQSKTGRALREDSPLTNVLLLELPEDVDEQRVLQAYASLEEIEYAELNYLYYIFGTVNDAFFGSQYALYSAGYQGIDAVRGWDIEQGAQSVMVAVIDTGVDYTHEDLAGKVVKGYDFVNEDFDPRDDHGHGTHVAGIIGATANNGRGIAGVCPGCSILAVKVITADGSGANTWIANGISNAVNLGANIINLSLGGMEKSQTIKLAVEQAYQSGAIVVAASGNDGSGLTLYPGAFPEVITVGATDKHGDHASFSNYGSHVELTAPGQAIYSTLPGNTYEAWNGTSMACPHIAGLAGLILSRNPQLTNQQVRQLMAATSQDLGAAGRDTYYGHGRVNAYSALTQTPGSGSGDTVPDYPAEPSPPSAPSYGSGYDYYGSLCGPGFESVAAVALLGLGAVHLSHRLRKRKK